MVHHLHKHPRFNFFLEKISWGKNLNANSILHKMWKMWRRRFLCERPQRKSQSEFVTSFTQIASTFLSNTLKWFIYYGKTWNGRKYKFENVKKMPFDTKMPFAIWVSYFCQKIKCQKIYPIWKWIFFPISNFSIIGESASCSDFQMGSSVKLAACNFTSNKTKKYFMQTSDAFETFYS